MLGGDNGMEMKQAAIGYQGKTGNNPRMYFFDNLKAFIILLMVVFHVAMGFTTWDLPWWWVNDVKKDSLFDLFILETDVYIMPIMFLIAGYFAALVLVKKKARLFWRDKLQRIVLPWIGGVLFIAPFVGYSVVFSKTDSPPAYVYFWTKIFFAEAYHQAAFWFLGVLTLFFVLLTVAYQAKPSYFAKSSQPKLPGRWFFPAFALLTAVPFFVANLFYWNDTWLALNYVLVIQPVRIGLYLCYFALGVHAWKMSWFTPTGYKPRLWPWAISAVVMMAVFLPYRVLFTIVPVTSAMIKAGHALLFSVFCLTATVAFIALFQRFVDTDAYLWRRLAANSYTIYFIHPCLLIPLAYLVQKMDINIWLKYGFVSVGTVVLCFVVSEYVIAPILSARRAAE